MRASPCSAHGPCPGLWLQACSPLLYFLSADSNHTLPRSLSPEPAVSWDLACVTKDLHEMQSLPWASPIWLSIDVHTVGPCYSSLKRGH